MGLLHLSLFGSVARDDATEQSDVDLAVTLDRTAGIDLFRFAAIKQRLSDIVGVPTDLVSEPVRNPRLQTVIDRDRVDVF